jgi:hypothetical protein
MWRKLMNNERSRVGGFFIAKFRKIANVEEIDE